MKISKLEKDLRKAKKEFGDVEVYVCVSKTFSGDVYSITNMTYIQDEVMAYYDNCKTDVIGICLDSILDEDLGD